MLSGQRPVVTLQQVLTNSDTADANPWIAQVMSNLQQCRTASKGYHLYKCQDAACGFLKYQYHSCRNRHCPQCGALKKDEWIDARRRELLPVIYYHVVFTLPHELNSIIMGNRRHLFKLLFDASAQTLLRFAKDAAYLGAKPGIISVLHTWGQQLSFHPHVHCIVSGGGIVDSKGETLWRTARKNDWRFLFPVKAINTVYRAKFLGGLKQLLKSGVIHAGHMDGQALIEQLYQKEWVVYAKAPFGGPQQVIEYLGRYTHKVAISNHRLQSIDTQAGLVTFAYKDYAAGGCQKQMTLSIAEFVRRFKQHILPKGFTKIRSYGYLGNRQRQQRINAITTALQLPPHPAAVTIPWQVYLREKYGARYNECPCCKKDSLVLQSVYYPKNHSPGR